MTPWLRNVLSCFLLTLVTHCQGLEFSMDKPQDSPYCRSVNCWSINGKTESFKSAVSLEIYDVTQTNQPVKLASLSASEPYPCVPQGRANYIQATGNVSISHALLKIDYLDPNYCRNRVFMCQLEYVDNNGNLDVIRQTVSSDQARNCYDVENERVKTEIENWDLREQITDLRQENAALKTDVSALQDIANSPDDSKQFRCYRGMAHNNSRETFYLWGRVPALCDTETDGGGWTIIQRRTTGDVSFYRSWDEYKNGFGSPDTDYWLGNENIHRITLQRVTEVRFDFQFQGVQYYTHYSYVKVDDESSNYRLSVGGGYDGNAGYDSFQHNNGAEFYTYDRDTSNNCVSAHLSGWWHNSCTYLNPNGIWGAQDYTGMFYYPIAYPGSVAVSEIKVRYV